MTAGFYLALLIMTRTFTRADANVLIAIYFLFLQFIVIIALALLFSSFSSPLLSALFSLSMFVAGTFAGDLRAFAAMSHGPEGVLARAASYIVPNLASLNVITRVSHDQFIPVALVGYNTLYSLLYAAAAASGAVLIFWRRDLK